MLFHFQKVIHAFITTRLDCNTRLSESSRSHLQLVQNAAARLLIGTREHITPILAALHWLPVKYSIRMLHTYSPTVCCWHATIIQPSVILKVWLSGVSWHSTLLSGTVTGTCFYAFASQLWTSQPNELKPTDGVSGWSLPSCTACFIVFFVTVIVLGCSRLDLNVFNVFLLIWFYFPSYTDCKSFWLQMCYTNKFYLQGFIFTNKSL